METERSQPEGDWHRAGVLGVGVVPSPVGPSSRWQRKGWARNIWERLWIWDQ